MLSFLIYLLSTNFNKWKTLDNKDLQILDLLQRNSNYSVKEIGEKIGLSFTPTYERIKHLEKNGQ
jgi:DNA-binding Lrp family transcriptional regulator